MINTIKKITVESLVILLIAAVFGATWNRHLLLEGFSGKKAVQEAPSASAVNRLPLPAGLLQVKDFFDRQEAIIVDARVPETFAAARIKGAVSLPVGDMASRLPEFIKAHPKDKPLVVYCNGYGCHDSMTVGEELLKAGYATVFVFEGGYPEWREAGFPVEGSNP